MQETIIELSDSIKAKIDKAISKYPPDQRQSAIKSALMLMQDNNKGYLTTEIMDLVADYIGMPKIAVYEVASFYTMFELEPVGKHKICVCTNISCMLLGSGEIVDHLKQKLGVDFNEITPDGKFSLKEVECMGACCGAPMFQIGDTYYEKLDTEQVDKILSGLN